MYSTNRTRSFIAVSVACGLAVIATDKMPGSGGTGTALTLTAPTAGPWPPPPDSQTPAQPPLKPELPAGSPAMQSGMSGTDDSGGNATANGTIGAQGGEGSFTGTVSASLNAVVVVARLNGATSANRNEILTQVDENVEVADRAMENLRLSISALKDGSRHRFDEAYGDARAKERVLKTVADAAREAPADEWPAARAQLADEYRAYAQAVENAEFLAQSLGSMKTLGATNGSD
jgi:hypothetical protein